MKLLVRCISAAHRLPNIMMSASADGDDDHDDDDDGNCMADRYRRTVSAALLL